MPFFSHIIECDKPQLAIGKSPKGVQTITVKVIISSLTPKGLLKTQLFEKKKGKLAGEEKIWPIFLVLSRVTSLSRRLVRVQKALRQLLWKL